ncbi:hypothetical protein ACFQ14_09640 [Pseudahrensia aquimaris]|uniref:Phage shock protein B n=1 Tax=Pseudahrensia aquimaris TaxID=744461 RepID=A0ABW3FGT1_9HYPH
MMETLFAWLPLVLLLIGAAWLARYQMRTYGAHVDRVNAINDRTLEINEQILDQNRETLLVLKEIQKTLKDKC